MATPDRRCETAVWAKRQRRLRSDRSPSPAARAAPHIRTRRWWASGRGAARPRGGRGERSSICACRYRNAVNYLAHLLLAEQTAESLIGNLAGDFVKGRIGENVPAQVADGIRHHRRVDAFTDSHPSVAAFRRVLIPEHGHYARVIADVFFDHFLATDFTRYSAESLDAFLRRVYAVIDPRVDEISGRLRFVYPRMRDEG